MNIYSLIVLGVLQGTLPTHSADEQSGVHKTSPSLVGTPKVQNFTEIHSPKDLSSSSSNRKAKRQSGRGSKSSKPKVKNYSGPNGYLQVIESEPQSYSTSYHHSSEQPTKAYSNTKRSKHGTDTRDERQKSRDDDYDYDDDRASHREREAEKPKKRYRSEDEDDADSSDHYDSGTKGYERSSKYNREKNDDYKKSGEIDFDTDDDYDTGRSGSKKGGGGRRGGQKKYRSSNRDNEDYPRSDASSDHGRSRSSDDNEEDFYKGYDEVDSYGQPRQRGGKRGKKTSRERSNRDGDEVERRDSDDDGEGDSYRRGSSTRPKSRRGPADDSDFDFEFNASDPFGEENAGDHRRDKSPKYISSTV